MTASTELYTGLDEVIEDVIDHGFNEGTLSEFRTKTGRYPTPSEVLSPAILLSQTDYEGSSPEDIVSAYRKIGANLQENKLFYAQPVKWLLFQQAQEESTLAEAVQETIEGTNNPKEYMPGIRIHTVSPKKYQRPENVSTEVPDTSTSGERHYVTSLDFSAFNFSDAADFFMHVYDLLPEHHVESHNNAAQVHERGVALADAFHKTAQHGNITKVDSARMNVYLKPNSSFHVRVDILGTKDEIEEEVMKLEEIAKLVYAAPNGS